MYKSSFVIFLISSTVPAIGYLIGCSKNAFFNNPSYILKNELVEVNVPDKILSMNKNSNIWNKLMSFIS